MQVSAYIPCLNSARTLPAAIASVLAQEYPIGEILVVDNGSTDDSAAVAERSGVRVIKRGVSNGRGASRARAMEEARCPLVLSCDAHIELPPDFLTKAVAWFAGDLNLAAVTGRITQREALTAADRWRYRHLFRTDKRTEVLHHTSAINTGGAVVRAEAVRRIGGYDPAKTEGEDADLGRRLIQAGYGVVFDPALTYYQLGSNSALQVLERYARWSCAEGERMDFYRYLRQVSYSVRVMAAEDLAQKDLLAAMISLAAPHYQYWRALSGRGG